MNKAVFLDRDGVIIEDSPHYVHKIDQLKLIKDSAKAIKILNESRFLVIIISNQSGIGRGYFTENDTELFNNKLKEKLKKHNAYIDAIYYCPHHPDVNCDCRKPKNGMLIKSKKEFNINLKRSYMIGDKKSDIDAGNSVGCKTILVLTGYGNEEIKNIKINYDYITKNLYNAVLQIVK